MPLKPVSFGVEPGKAPQMVKVTTFGGGGGGGGLLELPPPHEFRPRTDAKAITQRRSARFRCRRPFQRIPAKTPPKESARVWNGKL